MMPDGDTAAHLREQVGGLFFIGYRLAMPAISTSISKRINEKGERGRGLAPARIVQMIT
jgi:hypothetical protein